VEIAKRGDFPRGEAILGAGSKPGLIQEGSVRAVGVLRGQGSDPSDAPRIGPAQLGGAVGPGDLPGGAHLGRRADGPGDRRRAPAPVPSVMKEPHRCLHSLWRVVGARQIVGRSCVRAKSRRRCSGWPHRADRGGRQAVSRSRRSTATPFSFHCRSQVRASRRFSGSTARNRRRANSASERACSRVNCPWRSRGRAWAALGSRAAIATSPWAGRDAGAHATRPRPRNRLETTDLLPFANRQRIANFFRQRIA
jgi:hypothetical protein